MITVYVIPCDSPERSDYSKVTESLKPVADNVIWLEHRRLNERREHKTPYFGFLFSDEWLDVGLQEALPIYLSQKKPDFEYLVLFKRVIENVQGVRNTKIFQAPRIFRNDIIIAEGDSLVPENQESYKFLRVMDGWILEPERIV